MNRFYDVKLLDDICRMCNVFVYKILKGHLIQFIWSIMEKTQKHANKEKKEKKVVRGPNYGPWFLFYENVPWAWPDLFPTGMGPMWHIYF